MPKNASPKYICIYIYLPSLKLTANAPEKRPGPKRKRSYSNHPFLGSKMLVSGRVDTKNGQIEKESPFPKHHFGYPGR